ncbi:choice-of-anchor Q domain-containing protein [Wenzhouxiangella sp. EGI_FJ10409]|uniref:choice-of-anchor Q domain-containing protein n=1 Tax=Wenzhouxiangella sp. EGI_FJ10409 TaxID=3243767 RepID=UPI0035DF23D7
MSKYQTTTKYEFRQNIKPKIAPLTAAVSGALAAGSLQAATITVDTLDDGLSTGQCSLRAALYASTTNSDWDGCPAGESGQDAIVFASGLSGTITLGTDGLYFDGSTLPIGQSVSIDGDNDITIQGTGDAPVFYAKYNDDADYNADTVQIAQVTITGGGGTRGGGILSYANSLQLSDATIDGNVVSEAGGGVWHEPYSGAGELLMLAAQISGNTVTGTAGYAGGVGVRMPVQSDIQISSSTFSSNAVVNGGGGGLHLELNDYAYVDIKYSDFENNAAKYGNGGGIQADLGYATVDLSDNTFYSNDAYYSGGGLYLLEDQNAFQQADILLESNEFNGNSAGSTGGGASINVLYGDEGTISDPVKFVEFSGDHQFSGNESATGGGGLYLNLDDTVPGTLDGVTFSGNNNDSGGGGGLLAQVNASEITFQNSSFDNNATYSGDGGAVRAVVTDGAFYGTDVFVGQNEAQSGGGGGFQVVANSSDFGFEYSAFSNNVSSGCGGGLRLTGTPNEAGVGHSIFYQNQASCGGGMSLFASSAENVLVEVKYNEMSGNYANSGGATGGGAIFADFGSGSQVFLKNSTVSGNGSANLGGGVRFRGDMSAEIKYSTIANNYAYEYGGGVYNSLTTCNISNSILAGNENQTGLYQDLRGTEDCGVSDSLLAGAKYSDYVDNGGNILDTNPLLEPLANNGGNAGWTHALQAESPAIDAGSAGSFAPDYDQRGPGFPRVVGAALDMGAYEAASQADAIFSDRFEQP